MVFAKPMSELTFEDIQALVDNEEPESVTLEYKREIDTSPGGKKELAKDVSAIANSQGGHLIIGLAEEDHRPKMPDHFVDRMLGQQKVEEWLDQVLNSNIQQRVIVHIKPVPVPGKTEECVVVLHVPPSPGVPHMVTAQNDNRYYVRHNCEVLPAEQHEVRDMYERGRMMREEVRRYLKVNKYPDPDEDPQFAFGLNNVTLKLGFEYDHGTEGLRVDPPPAIVSFLACPSNLQDLIDTSAAEFRDWVLSTERRYYPPGEFVPQGKMRPTLEGLLYTAGFASNVPGAAQRTKRYLTVHRTGYTEYGYGDGQQNTGLMLIDFVRLMGLYWQFLGFVSDLYKHVGVSSTAVVGINMVNVARANLSYYQEWPAEEMLPPADERSMKPNIQVLSEMDIVALDVDGVETAVREAAERIGNAFGQHKPRCFEYENGAFPVRWFKPYG